MVCCGLLPSNEKKPDDTTSKDLDAVESEEPEVIYPFGKVQDDGDEDEKAAIPPRPQDGEADEEDSAIVQSRLEWEYACRDRTISGNLRQKKVASVEPCEEEPTEHRLSLQTPPPPPRHLWDNGMPGDKPEPRDGMPGSNTMQEPAPKAGAEDGTTQEEPAAMTEPANASQAGVEDATKQQEEQAAMPEAKEVEVSGDEANLLKPSMKSKVSNTDLSAYEQAHDTGRHQFGDKFVGFVDRRRLALHKDLWQFVPKSTAPRRLGAIPLRKAETEFRTLEISQSVSTTSVVGLLTLGALACVLNRYYGKLKRALRQPEPLLG